MKYSVKVLPEAIEDISIAFNWYERKKIGLGDRFLSELTEYYIRLEINPFTYSKINDQFRHAILRKFPYVIVYRIVNEDVIVYSVFHTSRSPKQNLGNFYQ